MKQQSVRFKLLDVFYIFMTALPILCGIVLQVLTKPASEGVSISGARIYFEIPMPLQPFLITESQINSALVIVSTFFLCLYLTHGLSEQVVLKRQHLVELAVEKVQGLVLENMGEYFKGFVPFVMAILVLSAFSSLLSLFGLYAPTSDVNIVGGWAILVFILITYYKFKCGPLYYVRGLMEPVAFLLPINVIGEFATPISMAFRHYGNVLSGSVISVLIAAGLGGVSSAIMSGLPGFLKDIPILQFGIPAVFSVYFDVFSGLLQAFIFAMLTMLYVSGAFPQDEYEKRRARKARLKEQKRQKTV